MLHAPAIEGRNEGAARKRSDRDASPLDGAELALAPPTPGNQAMLRTLDGGQPPSRPSRMPLLQRACACGGTCADCREKTAKFQTKLTINEPGDEYEQEADRVADQVMQLPAEPRASLSIQRLSSVASPTSASSDLGADAAERAVSSGGRLMTNSEQAFFEPRFGRDFSSVRIHDHPAAHDAARGVNARAYALGQNIAFAPGQYAPHTDEGRRLMAHELTHTLQQSLGGIRKVARQNGDATRAVSQVIIDCGANTITFDTSSGPFSYTTSTCNVTPGTYEARVRVRPGEVFFDLGETVPQSTAFEFAYEIAPGQPNPSTFFGNQSTVQIIAPAQAGLDTSHFELPVEFFAEPETPLGASVPSGSPTAGTPTDTGMPGYPLSGTGIALHVLASGDLSWLPPSAAAGRVLSPEYWSPFVPGRGFTTLDRLTNTLPRNLAPRIADELASGQPLTWVVQHGFTDAELRSIPDLVRRLNTTGVDSLTQAELSMLRRAAALHIGASSVGAPFASYTRPNFTPPFLSGDPPRYRVRVEVPSTSALDVSQPNAFNLGEEALTNIEEAEFLVTTNREGRITSVERIVGEGQPGFAMRHAGAIRWGGRILVVAGFALSAWRIAEASPQERPIVAAEEAGGHAGGWLGGALGTAGCVAFGIATEGVGLFLCGLAGGFAGGMVGSEVAGAAARDLSSGNESIGGPVCPSCHAMQRAWERDRARSPFEGFNFDTSLLPPDAVPLSPLPNDPGTAPLTSDQIAVIRRWLESSQNQ